MKNPKPTTNFDLLQEMLAEANARMNAAQPKGEPYVPHADLKTASADFNTDQERAHTLKKRR